MNIALYRNDYELLGMVKCKEPETIYRLGERFRLRFNSPLKYSSFESEIIDVSCYDLEFAIQFIGSVNLRPRPFVFMVDGENLKEVYENCSNGESLKQFIQDSIILKIEGLFR